MGADDFRQTLDRFRRRHALKGRGRPAPPDEARAVYLAVVLFFWMPTGSLPLAEASSEEQAPRLHRHGLPVKDLPWGLWLVLGCAMVWERERRYPSPFEFRQHLLNCAAETPTSSRL